MDILCCALALLGGVIGAGFASGREIVRFFAAHGAMGFIAVAFALAALLALFALLPIRLAAEGQPGLSGLCRARFGARVGGVCGALFFLLSAVTGGAMLAACAELSALVWPIRHAYALGFAVTAVLAALLCAFKTRGLAVVGGALCGLLPILLIRLLLLPPGEACFLPEGPPDAVLRAALDGTLTIDKLEAMTCVCSVGLDMIAVPGDTTADTISAIIADEAAIGMVNSKTTAVRIIPVEGKTVGDMVEMGGLLGSAPVMPVHSASSADFIARGGRIPAPLQSLKN